jgi:hypothetical protein
LHRLGGALLRLGDLVRLVRAPERFVPRSPATDTAGV